MNWRRAKRAGIRKGNFQCALSLRVRRKVGQKWGSSGMPDTLPRGRLLLQRVLFTMTQATHAFAVYGYHAFDAPYKTGKPLVAGVFQCFRIDQAKHSGERGVGRQCHWAVSRRWRTTPVWIHRVQPLRASDRPCIRPHTARLPIYRELMALRALHGMHAGSGTCQK